LGCLFLMRKEVVRLIDRLRVDRRWGYVLSIASVVAFSCLSAWAADPCTKGPDLWLPPDGTVGLADDGISIQVTSGGVCQGGVVTITVTVDNLSCGDAGAFAVRVTYGESGNLIGTKYLDGLAGCQYETLVFTWDTDDVPVGEHDINVCVDTEGTVIELNENNNCLTIQEDLLISPNAPWIEAEKTATDTNGGTYEPGDTVRYEVVITNHGCADQEDNEGHEFLDTLPAGLAPLGFVSATSGTIDVDGDQVVWDGEIPAGESVVLTFKAEIGSEVEELTELCNQGEVLWDSDGDGSNDAREPTDDPETAADDDPTCLTVETTTGPPPLSGTIDAPTLSEWGMILLSCLFVLAFWRMNRRRRATAT